MLGEEKAKSILQWASKNRAEDGFDRQTYYWTQQAKSFIEYNLKLVNEGLLAGVMGYSGQGKTALRYMIFSEMKPFYEERFPREAQERTQYGGSSVTTITRDSEPRVLTVKWDTEIYKQFKEKFTEWFAKEKLDKRKLIIIDTPDYGRKDIRLINRDLTQLGEFWSDLRAKGVKTNIVIFLQRELVKSQQHFFLLKMDPLLQLTPLKPEEMLSAYKMSWGLYEPFSEESLRLVAELSRGIFRRFMRYIRLAVQRIMEQGRPTVTVEDVNSVITDDILMQDAELEFTEMFRNQRYVEHAVKILKFLREEKSANQKVIAEKLSVHETIVSKIVSTLESNGYVKRVRGEGNTWNVEILKYN